MYIVTRAWGFLAFFKHAIWWIQELGSRAARTFVGGGDVLIMTIFLFSLSVLVGELAEIELEHRRLRI